MFLICSAKNGLGCDGIASATMLTEKQSDLLRFIHERLQGSDVPPSFEEMKEALDLKSKSGVHRLIIALEERGFIRRLPNRARALEVLRLPEVARSPRSRAPASNSVVGGRSSRPTPLRGVGGALQSTQRHEIPMMGRIAAGTPIAAIQTSSHMVSLPPDFLGPGDHFALEVRGDSMIEAGILDSDTVIIRRQDTAETGEIVVALVDDEEATLKRLRKRGGSIALEPANANYETRIFGPERVRIQGRLVSLLRHY